MGALSRARAPRGDYAQSVAPAPWSMLPLGRLSCEASGKKPTQYYSWIFLFLFHFFNITSRNSFKVPKFVENKIKLQNFKNKFPWNPF
jgi:hypothetical protein